MKMNLTDKKTVGKWFPVCLFMLGILTRVIWLGDIPAGIHQDEAYAGYEAYALLKTGMDSHGYVNPVYFISWGHGMNALYSYLTIPFVYFGGLDIFTIRLPQAVFGCATLPLFYAFLKRLHGERMAYIGLFLLAVNPWHIMLSRWGLEANLVPFFLLFGMYFLVKAYEGKTGNYLPAFAAFGLLMYCYAIMWLFVPLVLFLLLIYGIYYKRVKADKFLITGICIFGILSVPLFLFYLVNQGILSEVRTAWFSIPRMDSIRSGEVSIFHIKENLKSLLKVLVLQKDGMAHNSPSVGNYYVCSVPFLLLGGVVSLWRFVRNVRRRSYESADIMTIWMAAAFAVGCLVQEVNVNRINCIHLAVIYFGAYGIWAFIGKVKGCARKVAAVALFCIYGCSFAAFAQEYYSFDKTDFYYGYEEALDYAEDITDGEIGTVMISYPLLLFHSGMLPEEYLPQMQGAKDFGTVDRFGRYISEPAPESMETDIVYVVPKSFEDDYLRKGFETKFDNGYYVVIAEMR